MVETDTKKTAGLTDAQKDEYSMAVCAIRYCIGRRSYIVSSGAEWARKYGK
jgi:hypothetical protein